MVNVRTYLVLVCGPPGVGKTHFSTHFRDYIENVHHSSSSLVALNVHYDRIIDKRIESELIENNEWKTGREHLMRLIHMLIEFWSGHGQEQHQQASSFAEFVQTRDVAAINAQIKARFLSVLGSDVDTLKGSSLLLLLVDDIFYYESMRYKFYRMCFDNEDDLIACSYYSICLRPSSVDVLRERNRQRPSESYVPERALENIYEKFEYPKDDDNWEADYSMQLVLDSKGELHPNYEAILAKICSSHSKFMSAVETSRATAVAAAAVKPSDTDMSPSLVHECDLILRRLVNDRLMSVASKGELGKSLATRKAHLLVDIKNTQSNLHVRLARLNNDLVSLENELRSIFFNE